MKTRVGARRPSRPTGAKRHPRGDSSRRPEATAEAPLSAAKKVERSVIELPQSLTVKELGELLKVSPAQIIKELLNNGFMANINQTIDYDTAAIVAQDLGFETKEQQTAELGLTEAAEQERIAEDQSALVPRPPVVTIMGHVDHGKTSLLDAIRETNVTAREAGGITQHIGAYQVEIHGQKITFLDTPGHEAFTAMRARGAQATDIAILVVAADDGVMPQTKEAIDHARAANVPIIVALNKIDKPNANPERVKQQLADAGLLIEDWGGNIVCVPVSAKKKQGIEQLLEMILLVSEMGELKANPTGLGRGVIIEAELDKARGPVATMLVQRGTLKVSDNLVVGQVSGKVRAMFNDRGKSLRKAEPSTPVKILGLSEVPKAGDTFEVVGDERTGRLIAANRAKQKQAELATAQRAVTLDELFSQIQTGQVKELNIILKTDVQGSIDPIRSSLERLSTDSVKVKIIHQATGNITESDVLLAQASKAIIIGFSVRAEPGARKVADTAKVDVRHYDVIYNLVEDVSKALQGMLEPTYIEVIDGHAEVRQLFKVGKNEVIAGSAVTDGKIGRSDFVRVNRDGKVIFDGKIASLRRFKDDVREVATGYECGIGVEGFNELQPGDVIEAYRKEKAS
ncbi:MAG: translation initiation factor IF-2 [Chloroflexi bacterium]|nr:translation initiation factor IF-2 [Chloroflexota bacterium]